MAVTAMADRLGRPTPVSCVHVPVSAVPVFISHVWVLYSDGVNSTGLFTMLRIMWEHVKTNEQTGD